MRLLNVILHLVILTEKKNPLNVNGYTGFYSQHHKGINQSSDENHAQLWHQSLRKFNTLPLCAFFKPKEKQIEIFDKIETTINALQLVFVTCHDIKSTFPTDVIRATFYLICLYVLAKILQISLGTLRDAKVQEDIRKARDEALKYWYINSLFVRSEKRCCLKYGKEYVWGVNIEFY